MKRIAIFVAAIWLVTSLAAACDPPGTAADEPADEEVTETDEEEPEEAGEEAREAVADGEEEAEAPSGDDPLYNPELATDEAPEEYEIRFTTTQGEFTVAVDRQWAPHGADRLYHLVNIGFFEDVAFFRVIENFMAQFGLHGEPEVNAAWRNAEIPDDEVTRSNKRGKLTFATRGPDSRTTQLFINLTDNANLDDMGFSPVGEVADGMDVVDQLYDGYGEGAPRGQGPAQQRIQQQGNDYLRENFERLDYVESAVVVDD